MGSMLHDGIAWLAEQLQTSAGCAATYRRGAQSLSVTVVCEGGNRDREYSSRLGETPEETIYTIMPPEEGYCGFLVEVADLSTLSPAQPERGDKIVIGTVTYVLEAPDGFLPWRPCDFNPPDGFLWFWCHTKLSA